MQYPHSIFTIKKIHKGKHRWHRKTAGIFVIGFSLELPIISCTDFSKRSSICGIQYSCKAEPQSHINASSILDGAPIDSLPWEKNIPMVPNNWEQVIHVWNWERLMTADTIAFKMRMLTLCFSGFNCLQRWCHWLHFEGSSSSRAEIYTL